MVSFKYQTRKKRSNISQKAKIKEKKAEYMNAYLSRRTLFFLFLLRWSSQIYLCGRKHWSKIVDRVRSAAPEQPQQWNAAYRSKYQCWRSNNTGHNNTSVTGDILLQEKHFYNWHCEYISVHHYFSDVHIWSVFYCHGYDDCLQVASLIDSLPGNRLTFSDLTVVLCSIVRSLTPQH